MVATIAIDHILNFLHQKLIPKMIEPNVWLFIFEDKVDVKLTTCFATSKLEQYEYILSSYVPSRAEMLNNVTNQGNTLDVHLLFFCKKDNH
jgi:hypothetical protein